MRASKESRVHERWREQAARLIALACWPESEREDCDVCECVGRLETQRCTDCRGTGVMLATNITRLLDGRLRFDAALVRSYCESLMAEGQRLEAERVVFMDWTRERGLGPETFAGHMTRPPLPDDWPGHARVLATLRRRAPAGPPVLVRGGHDTR